MKGLLEHDTDFIRDVLVHKKFLNKNYFYHNIYTLNNNYTKNPRVIVGEIKEIDTKNITGMHHIKQVRALLIIGIYFFHHG